MLSYTDLKPSTCIVLDGEPYIVLEYSFVRKQQRKPVVQTKIKSLINGRVVEKSFYPRDVVEEADIGKKDIKFLYANRGEYWFCLPDNPKERFQVDGSIMGSGANFLKSNSIVSASYFSASGGSASGGGDKIIKINLPIKTDLKVVEAPPAVRGDTAQGGVKQVKLETGVVINVPLFINQGDIVRVNTESGEYVERAEKGKE